MKIWEKASLIFRKNYIGVSCKYPVFHLNRERFTTQLSRKFYFIFAIYN